eukprot:1160801-Pelagomonas_calceolata.AAC.2
MDIFSNASCVAGRVEQAKQPNYLARATANRPGTVWVWGGTGGSGQGGKGAGQTGGRGAASLPLPPAPACRPPPQPLLALPTPQCRLSGFRFKFTRGDLQPECLADRPVTGPRQST